MKRRILTVILVIFSVPSFSQFPVVRINHFENDPNEPGIAINPQNPGLIIAGANINNLYISRDTGRTWQETTISSPLGVWGDPVLIADSQGNFYFAHLSRKEGLAFPEWIDRIVVQKWNYNPGARIKFSEGAGIGHRPPRMQDKPWIAIDNRSRKGNVYLSWTEFDKYNSADSNDHSRIRFARSADGGMSFHESIAISDTVGDCLDDDNTLEGAVPAVGPDGTVYVAWAGYQNIYFDRSYDGGISFGADRIIHSQPGGWAMDLKGIYRCNGMPFLRCDAGSSPHSGNLYLLWGDTRYGDADILFSRSHDGGANWSAPQRLHTDFPGNGSDQFFANMCIDPVTGYIYAVYYDRRHSLFNVFMDVYLACSKDGGRTFSNTRISGDAFPEPGKLRFFGDYTGIDAFNGIIRPVWTQVNENGLGVYTALMDDKLIPMQRKAETTASACIRGSKLFVHYRPRQDSRLQITICKIEEGVESRLDSIQEVLVGPMPEEGELRIDLVELLESPDGKVPEAALLVYVFDGEKTIRLEP